MSVAVGVAVLLGLCLLVALGAGWLLARPVLRRVRQLPPKPPIHLP